MNKLEKVFIQRTEYQDVVFTGLELACVEDEDFVMSLYEVNEKIFHLVTNLQGDFKFLKTYSDPNQLLSAFTLGYCPDTGARRFHAIDKDLLVQAAKQNPEVFKPMILKNLNP